MEELENNQTPNASSVFQTLDVAAVAKKLNVSRATVLRWIKAGKLPGFFRIGTKWLIRSDDFERFISQKIHNN